MDTRKENEYANVEAMQHGDREVDPEHLYMEVTGKDTEQYEDTTKYYSVPGGGQSKAETVKGSEVYQAILHPKKIAHRKIILVAAAVIGAILLFVLGFIIGHFTSEEKQTSKKEEIQIDSAAKFECQDPWLTCDLAATSYGYDDPDRMRSRVLVNGVDYPPRKGRGISVIQLDPANCTLLLAARFDTYANESHAAALSALINRMTSGVIILLTDDAYTSQLGASEISLLHELGSHAISYEHRSSLVIMAFKHPDGDYESLGSAYKPRHQGPAVLSALIMANGTYTKYLTYTSTSTLTL